MLKNDFEIQNFAILRRLSQIFVGLTMTLFSEIIFISKRCPADRTKNLTQYLSLLSQKNCRERYCRRRKQNFNIENLLFLALNLPHSCRCKAAFSKDLPAPSAKSNFTSSLSSFFARQKLKFISNYRQVNFVHNTIPNFYLF